PGDVGAGALGREVAGVPGAHAEQDDQKRAARRQGEQALALPGRSPRLLALDLAEELLALFFRLDPLRLGARQAEVAVGERRLRVASGGRQPQLLQMRVVGPAGAGV